MRQDVDRVSKRVNMHDQTLHLLSRNFPAYFIVLMFFVLNEQSLHRLKESFHL